jgi:hypothetical protein
MRRQDVEHLLAVLDPAAGLDPVPEHELLAGIVHPRVEQEPPASCFPRTPRWSSP